MLDSMLMRLGGMDAVEEALARAAGGEASGGER